MAKRAPSAIKEMKIHFTTFSPLAACFFFSSFSFFSSSFYLSLSFLSAISASSLVMRK